MSDESILSAVNDQIKYHQQRLAEYQQVARILAGIEPASNIVAASRPSKFAGKAEFVTRPTRTISEAGKARIAAAQKKRWAKVKREKKLDAKETRG